MSQPGKSVLNSGPDGLLPRYCSRSMAASSVSLSVASRAKKPSPRYSGSTWSNSSCASVMRNHSPRGQQQRRCRQVQAQTQFCGMRCRRANSVPSLINPRSGAHLRAPRYWLATCPRSRLPRARTKQETPRWPCRSHWRCCTPRRCRPLDDRLHALGAELALRGRRVVLEDLDPGKHLSRIFTRHPLGLDLLRLGGGGPCDVPILDTAPEGRREQSG
jgi:hypothetical protein